MRERALGAGRGRGRDGETERISSRPPLSVEPSTGLNLTALRPLPEPKSRVRANRYHSTNTYTGTYSTGTRQKELPSKAQIIP